MSAGRRDRRLVAKHVGTVGSFEFWMRNRTLYLQPVLDDDYPPELKAAVDRRRRANFTGVCDCGARSDWTHARRDRHGICRIPMEHADDCPVPDDRIAALYRKYGYKVMSLDPDDGRVA